jgi:hypothetical protein
MDFAEESRLIEREAAPAQAQPVFSDDALPREREHDVHRTASRQRNGAA